MIKIKHTPWLIFPLFLLFAIFTFSLPTSKLDQHNPDSSSISTGKASTSLKLKDSILPTSNQGFSRIPCSEEAPITVGNSFRKQCVDSYIVVGNSKKGPFGYFRSIDNSTKRKLADINELIVVEQNFENLGPMEEVTTDKNGKKITTIVDKPVDKKIQLAKRLKEQNADIIVGIEIKDIKTATDFVEKYLDSKYQALLIEGNDERGIDICFFVKKDLPFDLEIQSHKLLTTEYTDDNSWNAKSSNDQNAGTIFSRDLPFLSLRKSDSSPRSKPLMTIVGAHYKAQMPKPENDEKAYERRLSQVQVTSRLLVEYLKKFPDVPLMLTGDLNNDVRPKDEQPKYPPKSEQEERYSYEFEPFFKINGFTDSLNLNPENSKIDPSARGTQYFFKKIKGPDGREQLVLSKEQLDAALVNGSLLPFIKKSNIFTDLNERGQPIPNPSTPDEIELRSSDHDGTKVTIDFQGVLSLSR